MLKWAHDEEYLKALESVDATSTGPFYDKFGLSYDCPPRDELYRIVSSIYGGTIQAARALALNRVKVAINWSGGWHHAQRKKASGFCYVNDINGAIHCLTRYKLKVMYIDLDVHHGDGVEAEFRDSKKVVTYSTHHFAPGFYPGTGGLAPAHLGHVVNIPLKEHVGDADWCSLNRQMISKIFDAFNPDVFVVLAGADCLYNDDHRALKVTQPGYLNLMRFIQSLNRRMLILGGGGYNEPATAKLWTLITAQACGLELPDDIPDEYDYFNEMGPDFTINDSDTPGGVKRLTDEERSEIVRHVTAKCNSIRTSSNLAKLPSRPFKRRKLSMPE